MAWRLAPLHQIFVLIGTWASISLQDIWHTHNTSKESALVRNCTAIEWAPEDTASRQNYLLQSPLQTPVSFAERRALRILQIIEISNVRIVNRDITHSSSRQVWLPVRQPSSSYAEIRSTLDTPNYRVVNTRLGSNFELNHRPLGN